jgi:DNA-binding LacI/PurR family transcriptional regulator
VVGYGDEMNKSPRIPTVAVPKEEMGRIAFERLLEISNEPTRKRTVVTVDTELVPVIDKD